MHEDYRLMVAGNLIMYQSPKLRGLQCSD